MTQPYATANGIPVIACAIVRPRVGNWYADLTVDSLDVAPLSHLVTININGGLELHGVAIRYGLHHDTVFARIVGGTGGLNVGLPAKAYTNVPARIPLMDALTAAGETLSPTCDPGLLGKLMPKWARIARTVSAEIVAIVEAVGATSWRILTDGTVWIGNETWPPTTLEWQEMDVSPASKEVEIASEVPNIHPGQTFSAPGETYDGERISLVQHIINSDEIRHHLAFEDGTGDRSMAALDGYMRARIQPKLDLLASYWAVVATQNSDGTLEVTFDDVRLPGMSQVPIRYGVPGVTAKVAAGARVLVSFTAGVATKPFATVWESASVTELAIAGTLIKLNAGTDALVKGTTYRTAEDTLLTALGVFATACGGALAPLVTPAATLNTAIAAFQAAAATYLSTTAKTA